MDWSLLTAFWMLSFSLVMTPGADWAYAISAGLRDRAVFPAVTGMLIGYLMITLVVAAGIGALVARLPALLGVLTIVGAAYLLYLGVGILKNPPMPSAGGSEATTWPGLLLRGFVVSGVNPKALLLFLALLPQFTSRAAQWPIAAQIAAMGLVQIVNCAVVYLLVGFSARAILRTRPHAARRISQLSGAAMIAIASLLLAEQALALKALP